MIVRMMPTAWRKGPILSLRRPAVSDCNNCDIDPKAGIDFGFRR